MSGNCAIPGDLIPLSETRTCDKCKAYTWWATPRQTKWGRCLTCALVPATNIDASDILTAAILDLLDAFPGSTVVEDWQPERYPPNTYVGPGAGPCVDCRGRIRRYGAMGNPLCADCWDRRVALRL